jgi:glucan phosphoethanolaminetransferase (alkaline phosphatase superfamily)
MNCLGCNTPNEEGAKFCKNCGIDLTHTPSNENKNSKSSDILLITYLCMTFFILVFTFALEKLVDDWYEGPAKYIRGSLWVLSNLSMILIPLAIKNKSLKVIGLILTIVIAFYYTYSTVYFMMN